MPASPDSRALERLLSRRVVDLIGADELKEKLAAGKKLRIKFGADPTSPDLHLGHAVVLRKLREFQDLGHTVVLIIGDYTALVGDPSGKSKTRPMLSPEEIAANAETYVAQVGRILDVAKAEVRFNGEWLGKLAMADIIRLASKFTVARLLERDDFSKRYKEGNDIHLHELLYPMLQAYDSVAIQADVELGGTDQRFNLLAGRELQKKTGQAEQSVMIVGPLLVGTDGEKKMSKSLGNYIGVSDDAGDMFGKVMSIPDAAIWDYFMLATEVPEKDIAELRKACEGGANPRDAKMRLAREIITLYHSADDAGAAEEKFIATFQRKEVPDDVPLVALAAGEMGLVELLVEVGLAESKTQARQLIREGAVRVGGEVVENAEEKVQIAAEPLLIQKGKRHFLKVHAS